MSEDDVRQYCFSASRFADSLRATNAIVGKGLQESEKFVRLGEKRISSKDTLRVYLSIASGFLDSLELRLRALARERSRSARVVVFPVYPDLDSATEELLEASNLFITDFDTTSFEINWPVSLGLKPSRPQYSLISEGSTWRLVFEGKETSVPGSKGIRYLAKLLANPGKSFTALELAHPETIRKGVDQSDLESTDSHSLHEYRKRLQCIDEDLEEARAYDREEETLRLEEEKDAILDHISSVAATGGKPRLSGDKEKARKAVSNAMGRMLLVLGKLNSGAARHFDSTLRMGSSLSYSSPPDLKWYTNPE